MLVAQDGEFFDVFKVFFVSCHNGCYSVGERDCCGQAINVINWFSSLIEVALELCSLACGHIIEFEDVESRKQSVCLCTSLFNVPAKRVHADKDFKNIKSCCEERLPVYTLKELSNSFAVFQDVNESR